MVVVGVGCVHGSYVVMFIVCCDMFVSKVLVDIYSVILGYKHMKYCK